MSDNADPVQANKDQGHLRLLSAFHYACAGIGALFACFPIFHIVLGIAIMNGDLSDLDIPDDFPIREFGLLFVVMGSFLILFGWAHAALMFAAGRCLKRHNHYYFCFVVAGLNCLWMPFGTILGVFTIIVLCRPSVKAYFGVV